MKWGLKRMLGAISASANTTEKKSSIGSLHNVMLYCQHLCMHSGLKEAIYIPIEWLTVAVGAIKQKK